MSLPRNEKLWLEISVTLPGLHQIGFRLATLRKKIISENHHWEVDYPPYTKRKIAKAIGEQGFHIESVEKAPPLYFYALSKAN
jgi:hypothetical protein